MVASFAEKVQEVNPELLTFEKLETLQVNLGNMCNLSCPHCHVNAGSRTTRVMPRVVMQKIINFPENHEGVTIDITGGAPELHPDFRYFVEQAIKLTPRLIVRTNLTVFSEEGMEWIPGWYCDQKIVLIASMPCYTQENVDKMRGNGVFKKSIKALQNLCSLGYGDSLELNLVYNPNGDYLPGSQKQLEADYKKQLFDNYGIIFNNLYTMTNAPLGRFEKYLKANNRLEDYTQLLAQNFNSDAVSNIMCRTLISIDWQGILYNCDFNQAAGLPIRNLAGRILELDDIEEVIQGGAEIAVDAHCYSCTAGEGSSCTGALI